MFRLKVGLGEAAKRGVGTGVNQIPDINTFGAQLALNGYQYLPSGLIIQWGQVNIDYASDHVAYPVAGGYSVNKYKGTGTFPVTFPNEALIAISASNDVPNGHISSIYISSTKGFSWAHQSTQGYVTSGGGGNAFAWFALGY